MEYTVYVTAANDAGESGYSPTVMFTTLPPVPSAPERPVITEVTDSKAIIEWQPLPVWQYILSYRIYVDGQAVADVEPSKGIQAAELTNLEAGVHYVTVSGINENMEGPTSRPVQFMIQAIPAPTGLTVANRGDDRILLTWDVIPEAVRYKVYMDGNLVGESKNNSYFLQGLSAETQYQVSVYAVLSDSNESAQANLDIQTLPPVTCLTLESVMSSIYEYIPDVMPGMIMIFVIGGALKIARSGKLAIRRLSFRGF